MAVVAAIHFKSGQFEVTEAIGGSGILDELHNLGFVLVADPRNDIELKLSPLQAGGFLNQVNVVEFTEQERRRVDFQRVAIEDIMVADQDIQGDSLFLERLKEVFLGTRERIEVDELAPVEQVAQL